MPENLKRNRFIPFRKADVVDMCIKESKLSRDDIEAFKGLCQILAAIFHFEFHGHLEKLKTCYAPFNPDADTRGVLKYSAAEKENLQKQLVAEMTAAFVAGHCGILPAVEQNSAAYLKGWLERLKADPSMLIRAGSEAQKAFDYIIDAKAVESPVELQEAA